MYSLPPSASGEKQTLGPELSSSWRVKVVQKTFVSRCGTASSHLSLSQSLPVSIRLASPHTTSKRLLATQAGAAISALIDS